MPAKSKDQQRAAAIALKAKREGNIDSLPVGAAKNMAKSMSEKELDKLASTKHKGLPEDKTNESNESWAGASLSETFNEEMLGTDEEGEAITSDKSTFDQIEDAGRDKEDTTGWDEYDDSWDNKVHADAPMAQSGRAMGSNVTGAARVSYEGLALDELDILIEQAEREYYTADEVYDLRHSPDHEHDYDNQAMIAQGEIDYEKVERLKTKIKDEIKGNLDWVEQNPETGLWSKEATPPSLELAMEIGDNITDEFDEWSWQAEILYDEYGDQVSDKDANSPSFSYRAKEIAGKELGKEAWEEWSESRGDLDEQALGFGDWGGNEDWDLQTFGDPVAEPDTSDIEGRLQGSLVDDMVDHILTHKDLHGTSVDEWEATNLLADFEYEYDVSVNDPSDVAAAEEAIKQAREETGEVEELNFESKHRPARWKKLAGILTETKKASEAVGSTSSKPLKEMSSAQLRRYVKRMASHDWEWSEVAEKLSTDYGVVPYELSELEPVFSAEKSRLQQEAMVGGVSNGGPAPGHRGKMNEDSVLDFLAQGKGHRVDVFDARDELAGLAYEIAGAIQGMHIDTSDRKTEKMTQNKLTNMYKFLAKLRNLTN